MNIFLFSVLVFILELVSFSCCIEPITTVLVGSLAYGVFYNYKTIGRKIGYLESCDDHWIPVNTKGLAYNLKMNVFGQELANKFIPMKIEKHFKSNPDKPLVLSFHGMPGTGKNYVTKIILENMFKKGLQSAFAHYYSGVLDFPDNTQKRFYKEKLENEVKKHIEECQRAVFIFDDIDKMPNGILDVLHPYIKRCNHIEDNHYSKLVFIFLSNIGQNEINNKTEELLNKWIWNSRNDFDVHSFQSLIMEKVLIEKGGLYSSNILNSNLIDEFIPFLPLEEDHVVKCAQKEISDMGYVVTPELTSILKRELNIERFSPTGCKHLSHIINDALTIYLDKKKKSRT